VRGRHAEAEGREQLAAISGPVQESRSARTPSSRESSFSAGQRGNGRASMM
jgi:hypothetical protein